METAAFLGMLGLGYAMSKPNEESKKKEGFESSPAHTAPSNYTNYASIVPGVAVQQPPLKWEAPSGIRTNSAKELDTIYNFPASTRIPSEPNNGVQGSYLGFPVPAITGPAQRPTTAVTPSVSLNTNGYEKTPVLAKEKVFISQLTGLPMKPEEFTHANMVPFFRGSPKQNMSDTANRNILDTYTGGGAFQQEKREQGAMFDPQQEPTGVPFGSEIATDFMQDRMNAPKNRAGERPFEQVRVGKGLGQGYTSNPSGGFQQADALVYARPRSTDELRVASNPKTTYEGVVVAGSHFITKPGVVGEVRKHTPDRFYLNENGERNFTTTGANLKGTQRPVQVLRDTTRPETTKEYEGPAKSQDFNATYTVPSTRAPMVKQAGSWGFRNADASSYQDKNMDSPQNDFGKSSIEIRPNERYYTSERGQTLNMKPNETGKVSLPLQDLPRHTRKDEMLGNPNQAGYVNSGITKGPAYDPNDIARTTIKETVVDNDWIGSAAGPVKLKVYDADDIARTTIKETTEDNDYVGTAAGPLKMTVYDADDIARTTIKETTVDNDWVGSAVGATKLTVYDPDDIARTTIRETTEDDGFVGNMAGALKGKIYDPTDIARTTTKQTTIDNDYLGVAAGPVMQTTYDSDDTAKTTIRETTSDNDWVGIVSPNGPSALTIYDPEDISRLTQRNTTDNFDTVRNLKSTDTPSKEYLPYTDIARVTDREALSAVSEYYGNSEPSNPKLMVSPFPDGVRPTQKASISAKSEYTGAGNSVDKKQTINPYLDGARQTQKAAISAKSAYTGSAGTAGAKAPRSENAERAMRHYAQKENIAVGRAPAGNIALFNGEDYVNIKFNKIESDYINDRAPNFNRVVAPPPSGDSLGELRPRAVLKLDVSSERMDPTMVSGLESNPYVIPIHSTAKKITHKKVSFNKKGNAQVKL